VQSTTNVDAQAKFDVRNQEAVMLIQCCDI
jgi:hypothetical protein